MLKGQAKTDYQREYMRKRRAVRPDPKPTLDPTELLDPPVRPIEYVIIGGVRYKKPQEG